MNGPIRSNLPSRGYAIKKDKPRLCQEIEETLSNKYGVPILELEDELSRIDNYYIKSRDTHYQGNWMQGLPHGKGRAIYPNGTYYIGKFQDGEAEDDKGILIFPNGAIYEGNVRKSKLEGRGRLDHKNAYHYEGEWHDNKPHGEGRQRIPEEDIEYVGPFRMGQKHCFEQNRDIKLKKTNPPNRLAEYRRGRETYKGEFVNGKMHGYGELTNPDKGVKYCGEFINGQKEGYGTLATEMGTLTGNFHKDVVNGDGVFRWKDGRAYEGQFKNNQFDGEGTVIFPEGNSLAGTWKDGQSQNLRAVFGSMEKKQNDDVMLMFSGVKKESSMKQPSLKEESQHTSNLYAKEQPQHVSTNVYAKDSRQKEQLQYEQPYSQQYPNSEGKKEQGMVESQTRPYHNDPISKKSTNYSNPYPGNNPYSGNDVTPSGNNPYSGNNPNTPYSGNNPNNPYSGNNVASSGNYAGAPVHQEYRSHQYS